MSSTTKFEAVQTIPAAAAPWYTEITKEQWKAFIAAGLGYGLEAMDLMLYAMVILQVMKALHLSSASGGLLASLSLFSAALGGIAFGVIADKWGRTKSLMASILIYSVFTLACGLSQTPLQLGISRVLLGFLHRQFATHSARSTSRRLRLVPLSLTPRDRTHIPYLLLKYREGSIK